MIESTRRSFLAGGIAMLGGAASLPVAARAPSTMDTSDPIENLRAVVRVQASLDEEDVPWWYNGIIYGVVGESAPVPMFGFEGMEIYWMRHLGEDEYQRGVRIDLRAYLSEAAGRYKRPVVCQDYKAPIDVFDRHLYEKGALTLHSLRLELGEQVFWTGVGLYLERHAHCVLETRDLMRAMEEVSGRSLE